MNHGWLTKNVLTNTWLLSCWKILLHLFFIFLNKDVWSYCKRGCYFSLHNNFSMLTVLFSHKNGIPIFNLIILFSFLRFSLCILFFSEFKYCSRCQQPSLLGRDRYDWYFVLDKSSSLIIFLSRPCTEAMAASGWCKF